MAPPTPKARRPTREPDVVRFFRGTGTDDECRSLEDILTWDNQLMEVCHNYIQWLFPTDEASRFNADAPLLDEASQAIFRGDEALQKNMRRGLRHFLAFLGLTLEGTDEEWAVGADAADGATKVTIADCFGAHSRRWTGPNNHNWKRVSRVLRCLGLVGMTKERAAFHRCLEQIVAENPELVDSAAVSLWRERAGAIESAAEGIAEGGVSSLAPQPLRAPRAKAQGDERASGSQPLRRVQGASTESQAREPEVVQFFRGTGTDDECRKLEDILTWDNQLMEVCHNYIQWLLPTDQPSRYNADAPLLDDVAQSMFHGDEALRNSLRRGLAHFLDFLGLSLCGTDADWNVPSDQGLAQIVRGDSFGAHSRRWSGPNNHNWKRVSRALRCLGLVGMAREQRALHRCLEEIVEDSPGLVDIEAVRLWRERSGNSRDSSADDLVAAPVVVAPGEALQLQQRRLGPIVGAVAVSEKPLMQEGCAANIHSAACSTRSRSKSSSSGRSSSLQTPETTGEAAPFAPPPPAGQAATLSGGGGGKSSGKGKGKGKGKAFGKRASEASPKAAAAAAQGGQKGRRRPRGPRAPAASGWRTSEWSW